MFIQLLSYFAIIFTFSLLISWPFINSFKERPFIQQIKPYIIGLNFGLAGFILTGAALDLHYGFMIHARFIFVLFSGLLGGHIALLISGLIIGLSRFLLEGVNPLTILLLVNFLALVFVLFFVSKKYPINKKNLSLYFWISLTEILVTLLVVYIFTNGNIIYIMLLALFTSISFYFICSILQQVKKSSDTVRETSHLQYIDYLTKLPNNKALQPYLQGLIHKNSEFNLLLIHVNDLHVVTATHGLQAGDLIIQQLGDIFQEYKKKNDAYIARVRGEGFIVVLKDTPPAMAVVEANNFIQAIAKHTFNGPNNSKIHISATVGICSYPDNGADLQSLTSKLILAEQYAKTKPTSYFHASNIK